MDIHNKSIVAKLLAAENITVVQEKVSTASFDVKNRVLRLPLWADVEDYVSDHLIGHEVGHALYTPLEGWHEAVCGKGQAYKSFLNVVEDARIERLIQKKYPGLRRSFIKSYRKLLKDGFFGKDASEINKMNLIDRINVFFKCGETIGVRFTAEERVWLDRISAAETWEDVQRVTEDLFAFCKEKAEEEQQQLQEMMIAMPEEGENDQEDEEDEEEGSGDEYDDEYDEGDDDGINDAYEDLFGDENDDEEGAGKEGGIEHSIASETDEEVRKAIDHIYNEDIAGNVYNYKLQDLKKNWNEYVISYKTVLKEVESKLDQPYAPTNSLMRVGEALYDAWYVQNNKLVNHMVKEFEMRKSAAQYARASVSKTGVIDTVLMNNYKITDDIFKKVAVVPEGKNHGFIMYLDMSGSMSTCMKETVDQLMLLAQFTRKIGVPFRVYGFSTYVPENYESDATSRRTLTEVEDKTICVHPRSMSLIELFNENMSRVEFTTMGKILLGSYVTRQSYPWDHPTLDRREFHLRYVPHMLQLGGTPLDHAITLGIPLAREFRKQKQIDILNTIFLTDGASHPMGIWNADETIEGGRYIDWLPRYKDCYLTIGYENKLYRPSVQKFSGRVDWTSCLMEIYREATGSINIGYRIIENGPRAIEREVSNSKRVPFLDFETAQKITKQYKEKGYVSVQDNRGTDEQFFLPMKMLRIASSKMEDIQENATKAQIRTAFKKTNTSNKSSRLMLVELMKRVA